MKVLAINGSARKDGNTATLINEVFKALQANGIETELIQLAGHPVRGCEACRWCFENPEKRCVNNDDPVNECISKMLEADAIVLGSPTYFSDVTAEMKALIDRAGYVAKANGDMFARKVGAAVVAVRRAGAMCVFDTINHFFQISGMFIAGSSYWNIGIGLAPGDVESDEEGLETMTNLGENIAWILNKIHSAP